MDWSPSQICIYCRYYHTYRVPWKQNKKKLINLGTGQLGTPVHPHPHPRSHRVPICCFVKPVLPLSRVRLTKCCGWKCRAGPVMAVPLWEHQGEVSSIYLKANLKQVKALLHRVDSLKSALEHYRWKGCYINYHYYCCYYYYYYYYY